MRVRWLALVLALLLSLSLAGLAGCGNGEEAPAPDSIAAPEPEPDPEYPVRVGDAVIEFRPARVVSLAPSLTEKIYDLGHGQRLVGVSDHQGYYPPGLVGLPAFGIATLPDVAGILEADPHIVFSVSELPTDAMAALERAGIPLVVLPSYAHSMAELADIYLGLSLAFSGRTTGQLLGERFMRELNAGIDEIAARYANHPRKNAVYLRALDFIMATGGTLEGELMERIGLVNIAAGQTGWVFDPYEAASQEGQELFAGLDVIFFDPEYVSFEALAASGFWGGLTGGLLHVDIDSQVFERQTLRLLGQLEIMASSRLPLQTQEYDNE